MLRPSMRGGVPVFSRPTRSGSSRSRAASAIGRRIAGAPAGMAFEADVDPAAQERADGQHHARARETRRRSR